MFITHDRTKYKLTKVALAGSSTPEDLHYNGIRGGEAVGPRGGIAWIQCFSNGAVRIMKIGRQNGLPYGAIDLWDEDAQAIRDSLAAWEQQ